MKWLQRYERDRRENASELSVEGTHIAVMLGDDYVCASLVFVDEAGSIIPIKSCARSMDAVSEGCPSGEHYEQVIADCAEAAVGELVEYNDYNLCFIGIPNWSARWRRIGRQTTIAATEGPGRHRVTRDHVRMLQNMAIEHSTASDAVACELFDCTYQDDSGVQRNGAVGLTTATLKMNAHLASCDRSTFGAVMRALRRVNVTKVAALTSTGPSCISLLREQDMKQDVVVVDLDRHSLCASYFRKGRFAGSTCVDVGYCTMLDAAAETCDSTPRELEWVWKGDRRNAAWMGIPSTSAFRTCSRAQGRVFRGERWDAVRKDVGKRFFSILAEKLRSDLGVDRDVSLRFFSDNALSMAVLVNAAQAAGYVAEEGEIDRVHVGAKCCRFPGFARTVAMLRYALPQDNASRWPALENTRIQDAVRVKHAVAAGFAVFIARLIPLGVFCRAAARLCMRRSVASMPVSIDSNMVGVLRLGRNRQISLQDGRRSEMAV